MQQQLDDQARPYAEALVAALKNEGNLSSPLVEAAFKRVPRHRFIDHFFLRGNGECRAQLQVMRPSSFPHAAAWLQAIYTNAPLATAYEEDNNHIISSSCLSRLAIILQALRLS